MGAFIRKAGKPMVLLSPLEAILGPKEQTLLESLVAYRTRTPDRTMVSGQWQDDIGPDQRRRGASCSLVGIISA